MTREPFFKNKNELSVSRFSAIHERQRDAVGPITGFENIRVGDLVELYRAKNEDKEEERWYGVVLHIGNYPRAGTLRYSSDALHGYWRGTPEEALRVFETRMKKNNKDLKKLIGLSGVYSGTYFVSRVISRGHLKADDNFFAAALHTAQKDAVEESPRLRRGDIIAYLIEKKVQDVEWEEFPHIENEGALAVVLDVTDNGVWTWWDGCDFIDVLEDTLQNRPDEVASFQMEHIKITQIVEEKKCKHCGYTFTLHDICPYCFTPYPTPIKEPRIIKRDLQIHPKILETLETLQREKKYSAAVHTAQQEAVKLPWIVDYTGLRFGDLVKTEGNNGLSDYGVVLHVGAWEEDIGEVSSVWAIWELTSKKAERAFIESTPEERTSINTKYGKATHWEKDGKEYEILKRDLQRDLQAEKYAAAVHERQKIAIGPALLSIDEVRVGDMVEDTSTSYGKESDLYRCRFGLIYRIDPGVKAAIVRAIWAETPDKALFIACKLAGKETTTNIVESGGYAWTLPGYEGEPVYRLIKRGLTPKRFSAAVHPRQREAADPDVMLSSKELMVGDLIEDTMEYYDPELMKNRFGLIYKINSANKVINVIWAETPEKAHLIACKVAGNEDRFDIKRLGGHAWELPNSGGEATYRLIKRGLKPKKFSAAVHSRQRDAFEHPPTDTSGNAIMAGDLVEDLDPARYYGRHIYGLVIHTGKWNGWGEESSLWALWCDSTERAEQTYLDASKEQLYVSREGPGRAGQATQRCGGKYSIVKRVPRLLRFSAAIHKAQQEAAANKVKYEVVIGTRDSDSNERFDTFYVTLDAREDKADEDGHKLWYMDWQGGPSYLELPNCKSCTIEEAETYEGEVGDDPDSVWTETGPNLIREAYSAAVHSKQRDAVGPDLLLVKHKLIIDGLDNIHAQCSCGSWRVAALGPHPAEEINREFSNHIKEILDLARRRRREKEGYSAAVHSAQREASKLVEPRIIDWPPMIGNCEVCGTKNSDYRCGHCGKEVCGDCSIHCSNCDASFCPEHCTEVSGGIFLCESCRSESYSAAIHIRQKDAVKKRTNPSAAEAARIWNIMEPGSRTLVIVDAGLSYDDARKLHFSDADNLPQKERDIILKFLQSKSLMLIRFNYISADDAEVFDTLVKVMQRGEFRGYGAAVHKRQASALPWPKDKVHGPWVGLGSEEDEKTYFEDACPYCGGEIVVADTMPFISHASAEIEIWNHIHDWKSEDDIPDASEVGPPGTIMNNGETEFEGHLLTTCRTCKTIFREHWSGWGGWENYNGKIIPAIEYHDMERQDRGIERDATTAAYSAAIHLAQRAATTKYGMVDLDGPISEEWYAIYGSVELAPALKTQQDLSRRGFKSYLRKDKTVGYTLFVHKDDFDKIGKTKNYAAAVHSKQREAVSNKKISVQLTTIGKNLYNAGTCPICLVTNSWEYGKEPIKWEPAPNPKFRQGTLLEWCKSCQSMFVEHYVSEERSGFEAIICVEVVGKLAESGPKENIRTVQVFSAAVHTRQQEAADPVPPIPDKMVDWTELRLGDLVLVDPSKYLRPYGVVLHKGKRDQLDWAVECSIWCIWMERQEDAEIIYDDHISGIEHGPGQPMRIEDKGYRILKRGLNRRIKSYSSAIHERQQPAVSTALFIGDHPTETGAAIIWDMVNREYREYLLNDADTARWVQEQYRNTDFKDLPFNVYCRVINYLTKETDLAFIKEHYISIKDFPRFRKLFPSVKYYSAAVHDKQREAAEPLIKFPDEPFKMFRTFRLKRGGKGKVVLELNIKDEKKGRNWDTLEPVRSRTLSISGSIYSYYGADEGGGQCQDRIKPDEYMDGDELGEIIDIWNTWHLNDLKSGTKAQDGALKAVAASCPTGADWYSWALDELRKVGLLTDRGYTFGNEWLIRPLPDSVISRAVALFGGPDNIRPDTSLYSAAIHQAQKEAARAVYEIDPSLYLMLTHLKCTDCGGRLGVVTTDLTTELDDGPHLNQIVLECLECGLAHEGKYTGPGPSGHLEITIVTSMNQPEELELETCEDCHRRVDHYTHECPGRPSP